MSKRYVIQVFVVNEDNATLNAWETVQHPNGGDWKTRSRSRAIADAAKLVQAGETRELRVMLSKPVFELLDAGVDNAAIVEASKVMYNSYLDDQLASVLDDADDEADSDEDEDEDEVDEPQFELVTNATDPDAPKLI